MSIATVAIGEMAIAGQVSTQKSVGRPPPKSRLVTAKADQIQSPEPR